MEVNHLALFVRQRVSPPCRLPHVFCLLCENRGAPGRLI